MKGFTLIVFVVISLCLNNDLLNSKTSGFYYVRFRCCFNDSAIINNTDTIFLKTNESVDAVIDFQSIYKPTLTNPSYSIRLFKTNDSLLIQLPETDSLKYVEIYKSKTGIRYGVSNRVGLLK